MTDLCFQQIHYWFYNKNRGGGSGSGSGSRGQLRLTSTPIKMLAPAQAYWKMYNNTKIRVGLLRIWKEEQGIVDNTGHLGIDEGLVVVPKLTAKEQEALDDAIIKAMPIGFRTKAAHTLYKSESQETKDAVDRFRKAGAGLVEQEIDLLLRCDRLVLLDRLVISYLTMPWTYIYSVTSTPSTSPWTAC